MGTKTITVTEDAYNFIKSIKGENESFSGLLIRLAKEKSVGERFFGILKGDIAEKSARLKKIRSEVSSSFEKRKCSY